MILTLRQGAAPASSQGQHCNSSHHLPHPWARAHARRLLREACPCVPASRTAPRIDIIERGEYSIRGTVQGEGCLLEEAVAHMAGVSLSVARELVELGAVYLGEHIRGQGTIKWRRALEVMQAGSTTDRESAASAAVNIGSSDAGGGSSSSRSRSRSSSSSGASGGGSSSGGGGRSSGSVAFPPGEEAAARGGGAAGSRGLGAARALAVDRHTALAPGSLVRVHPQPKRFPACHTTDWRRALVSLDPSFIIVNKPGGLPCMRHESNSLEEVAGCLSRALGLGPLEACHRLDQWTTGLLVLARSKEAGRRFKSLLQARTGEAGGLTTPSSQPQPLLAPEPPGKLSSAGPPALPSPLRKVYSALTHQAVPLGPLRHYMYDGPFDAGLPLLSGGCLRTRGPRLLSEHAHPGWKLCELQVLDCELAPPSAHAWLRTITSTTTTTATAATAAAAAPASLAAPATGALSPAAEPDEELFQSRVLLVTGRTHQIRAQLAALGAPLVGDVMYGGIPGLLVDGSGCVSDPEVVAAVERLPQMEGPLGLHAAELSWGGREYRAPAPWEEERGDGAAA